MNPTPFSNARHLEIKDIKKMNSKDAKIIEEVNQWHSCCGGTTDSRLLKFFALYLIIFMVFIFCLVMLYNAESCAEETTYVSLLTFILGLVIPANK